MKCKRDQFSITRFILLSLLILGILATGCGKSMQQKADERAEFITLKDGTRCVIIRYDKGIGLSCDWSKQLTGGE